MSAWMASLGNDTGNSCGGLHSTIFDEEVC